MNNKNNGHLFRNINIEDFKDEINSICKGYGLEKFTDIEMEALYADYKDPKKPGNKFVEFMEGCFGPKSNKRTINNDPLKEPTDRISKQFGCLGETPQYDVILGTSTFNPMGLEAIINEVQDLINYKKTNKHGKEKCAEPTKQKSKEKDLTEDIERIIQEAMNNMDEKSFQKFKQLRGDDLSATEILSALLDFDVNSVSFFNSEKTEAIARFIVESVIKMEEKRNADKPGVNSSKTVREKVSENKKKEQSKEPVKEAPVKKDTKVIPPSFEEIKKQLDYAVLNRTRMGTPFSNYKSGVETALKWVLGLSDTIPFFMNYREFIIVDTKTIDLIKSKIKIGNGQNPNLNLSNVVFSNVSGQTGVMFDKYLIDDLELINGNVLILTFCGESIKSVYKDLAEFEKHHSIDSMSTDHLGGFCFDK